MRCTIEFSQPYQRFQVRNGFQNLNLPTAATISVRNSPRWDTVGTDAPSSLDTIDAVRVDGFTDWIQVAAFVQSLPPASFDRIARISWSV